VRFWDASALVPLLFSEGWSEQASELLREDASMVVWWGSRVECISALRRREREGALGAADARRAVALLDALAGAWSEVLPSDPVRAQAERALAVHPLRAADALQLGAALAWRREPSRSAELVCLDERLRDAASREGFTALPAETDEGLT
jgi:predicted nucleic acid-binding protein